MRIYTFLAATACSGGTVKEDIPAAADTAAAGDTATTDGGGATELPETGLNGAVAADALPLPAFSATSHDGGSRGPDDLRGHPTAVWFFPAAGTYG